METWELHKSQNIIDHHNFFVQESHIVHERFKETWPDKDSTWGYRYYNVFAATSPSPLWYNLFKELNVIVRNYVKTDDPLWIQAWLNFHEPDQVLDWHGHDWPYHGYISIDPKGTRTVFKGTTKERLANREIQETHYDYEVKNEIGNIYIGPGYRQHKVEVDDPNFNGPRVTIGFDITDAPDRPWDQWGLIPLL